MTAPKYRGPGDPNYWDTDLGPVLKVDPARAALAEPSPPYRLTPADLKVFLEEARAQIASPSEPAPADEFLARCFQDAAGTIPCTAPGQPVGLLKLAQAEPSKLTEAYNIILAMHRDIIDYGSPQAVSKRWATEFLRQCEGVGVERAALKQAYEDGYRDATVEFAPDAPKGGHVDTEGEWLAQAAHLNCPHCGGSGHMDDITGGTAQAAEPVGYFLRDGWSMDGITQRWQQLADEYKDDPDAVPLYAAPLAQQAPTEPVYESIRDAASAVFEAHEAVQPSPTMADASEYPEAAEVCAAGEPTDEQISKLIDEWAKADGVSFLWFSEYKNNIARVSRSNAEHLVRAALALRASSAGTPPAIAAGEPTPEQIEHAARWISTFGGVDPDKVLDVNPTKLAWQRHDLQAKRLLTEVQALASSAGTPHGAREPEPFRVGNTYRTQAGELVKFVGVSNEGTTYETMYDEKGHHRYTRRDFGRCTGTAHDYSYPGNTPPLYAVPPAQQAREPSEDAKDAALLEKCREWIDEALTYVESPSWSPSMAEEGKRLLGSIDFHGIGQSAKESK